MNLHDAWTALRHGGNLLSPEALGKLPAAPAAPRTLADHLRAALIAVVESDKPAAAAVGHLLDTVLEEACGLRAGWRKGSAVGAADAEKLLDGSVLKPRRCWNGPTDEALAVFVTEAMRIGVGRGRRPLAQVAEYLRRRGLSLAMLTNGRQWRLVWADADSLAWTEWEAERWLAGDRLGDELEVLRQVLSPAALQRGEAEQGPLMAAVRDTRRGQGKLSKELGERVRRAVEALLHSRQPLLRPVWDQHHSGDLYVAACHFVMRLVVTLFAEARELLPVDNPVYHQAYGLRGLLDQLDRLSPERRRARQMAWPRLLALFRLLYQGSPHPAVTLPAYGGELFRPGDAEGTGVQRALALLEALPEPPDDDVIHQVLVLLTRTTQRVREGAGWRTVAAPVDFTELTSEYIGILYEGLLDYELRRAGDEPVVFLNLGDQPALPLDRLEAMDDKSLAALVEKAKVKRKAASAADGDEENEDDEETEEEEDSGGEENEEGEAELVGLPTDEGGSEDERVAVRVRAVAWGRRAAEVGKLVRKLKARSAAARAAWAAELDAAAQQLVADVKLPGEIYLVRWGGTRKGAGTFYTRPQLTLPTVRRTLSPLICEEGQEGADRRVRTPEALLSLKVCDPAMGSGSFLVAALRVLTEAAVESLHVHGRIERGNGHTTVRCEPLPEADRSLPTEGFEERLEALVRRAVVEHCLYGVDKDPLAVELARVALWIDTLDRRLPFTFLDHKLRCGDALVGTWLDRFRDYPLLCFDRQSPDEKVKGVHHEANLWHKALKAKRSAAIGRQVELLDGQLRSRLVSVSDEDLKAAVERVRGRYAELRAVPAGRPDERARIWRERIQKDEALAEVRRAFDTWCALWFWPLDDLVAMPLPGELHAPSQAARAVVETVTDRQRFFHWELEFPDVFTVEGAGFDAVVGNPPWEIQKPNSKEFFSNHDPLYRAYGKVEGLEVQRALCEVDAAVEEAWLGYRGDFKDRGNFVRNAAEPFGDAEVAGHDGSDVNLAARQRDRNEALHHGWRRQRARHHGVCDPAHPFRHQGSADLNTYKMFVEAAHALLRPGGQLGMLVPSGLYTDKGTGPLRRLLLTGCRWRWLYGFENRNRLFDIHRSFKFCVAIAQKGGQTQAFQAAFMRHDLEDWAQATGALDYPAERVAAFSPGSLSILEIRSERDLEVLTKIYGNSVLLGDDGPGGWGIRYAREFDMTNDARLFIARDRAEADGYRPDAHGRWVDDAGQVLLPLYEGRMIGQFDFSEKGWVSGRGRGAVWREIPWEEKRVEPQYTIEPSWVRLKWTERWLELEEGLSPQKAKKEAVERSSDPRTWKMVLEAFRDRIAFMDITSATNRRTMIATRLRGVPCGNSAPVLLGGGVAGGLRMAGVLNSFVYDWIARARCGGLHLNWHVIAESVLPRRFGCDCLTDVVVGLVANSPALCGALGEASVRPRRAAVTRHERIRLRCALDAIVAVLYGLDRDDLAWILKDCDHPKSRLADKAFCRRLDPKGFWRVDNDLEPELRHTVLSLAAYDDLQAAIAVAGDRDRGIEAFCSQSDGDGWRLPETLCVADLGLARTVDAGTYDERARVPQPVRRRLGERFLAWQLAQSPEESWAECERHAKAILEGMPAVPADVPQSRTHVTGQISLFGTKP